MRPFRHHWPALLTFTLALAVYLLTLCPTVFVEGTGENIVCAWTLSVPHPPGFPLFCLLGKAFSELARVGSIAYRINVFSAVMGAAAVTALYFLLRALALGPLAAVAAALAFAFSATFWRQSTIAEVYTLSLTLVIAQLVVLVRWRSALAASAQPITSARPKGKRRDRSAAPPAHDRHLLWFAFLFGLGLTVHYNHLLLLPAYLYFIVATDRALLRRGRTWAKGITLVALGFSLHLYAPIRSLANPPIDWGNPETLSNWWRYLTAEQYRGRMFHLPMAEVAGNLRTFLADLPQELWWSGLVAALGGAAALFCRDRRLFSTTVIIILVVLAWTINYDIPWEINVYYLQALVALALWVAFAIEWVAERLARARLRPVSALILAVPAALLVTNFRENDLRGQTFVLDNARDVAGSVGGRGVVVLPATNPTFAMLYLRHAERKLADVAFWSQTDRGVFPTDLAIQPAGVSASPAPTFADVVRTSEAAVFWVDRQPRSELFGLALVPWGCVYRAVPADQRRLWLSRAPTPSPLPFALEGRAFRYGAEERLIACRYLLIHADYAWERGEKRAADRLYREASRIGAVLPEVSAQLGLRYAEQGRDELAIATYLRAIARKDDSLLRNRLGAIYGRQDRLAEAEEQFRAAIKLKPDCAEAYANLGSVYGRMGRIEEAVAQTEKALSLEPTNLLALRNLGFAYAQIGRTEEARRLLERALEINPHQDDVRSLLAGR